MSKPTATPSAAPFSRRALWFALVHFVLAGALLLYFLTRTNRVHEIAPHPILLAPLAVLCYRIYTLRNQAKRTDERGWPMTLLDIYTPLGMIATALFVMQTIQYWRP